MKDVFYSKNKLNKAGQLARTFIQSKLTLLLIVGILLFGVLALERTPRSYNPEIIVPAVTISVSRPGSDSQEMLHQIVRPLEGLMASISGVEHTYGMAIDDSAMVTVRFKVNENEEASLVKVYNQINSNMDKMPPGTLMPLIRSISLYDVPLVTLTLHAKGANPVDLRTLADKVLEELRTVPQVGKSWVMGASPQAIRVWLNPKHMAEHAISIANIQQAFSVNNISLDAGTLEHELSETSLRIEGSLISNQDLANIIIGTDGAKPILLKDIATIEKGPQDETIASYFAYGAHGPLKNADIEPAVTIALARQKGSNGVDVAKALLNKLEQLQNSQLIPKNIDVSITRNYGDEANDAVNTLVEHLGIAILSVVVLLMVFLGWREASVVVFSIPLILCLVLGIGWLSGQTINRITLFALILSLGLLVDDSIVVIENIHRHIIKGVQKNFTRLVIYAANEIGKPTIIATFTVMLALLPMDFVGGMMGPFMAPIPFNAPLAMIVSLFIAYSVVPYLAYRWLRTKAKKQMNEHHQSHSTWLQRAYLVLFKGLLYSSKKRHLFYLIIVLLLFAVLLQPAWQFIRPAGPNGPLSPLGVEIKMLPDDNVNTFLVSVDAGANATLTKTNELLRELSATIQKNPYVTDLELYLGESAPEDFAALVRGDNLLRGSQYGQIRVNLVNKHHRAIGSHQIATQVYQGLVHLQKQHPQSHIKLFESPPGPPVRSQMEAGLYGPNYNELRSVANKITSEVYPKIYGMINIDNSVTQDTNQYRIEINHNAVMLAGLAPKTVAQEVSALFKGISIGNAHEPNARQPEHIILRLPQKAREVAQVLNQLCLKNQQQQLIPLAKIATLHEDKEEKPIFTKDQTPVVYVTGEVLGTSPAYAVTSATNMLKKPPFSMGVENLGFHESQPNRFAKSQLFWLGEMRLTLDVFRDLGSAFIVAIVLIYILLTAFYQSFFIPLIIMGAIPLTVIGVFPGHWLMNQPFTATSMIGVIALAGIVVRNSLLLIDFILEHQHRGSSIVEAVIESGVERILPIVLTALAIILGSAVMLSDPVFGGLAISLIFGSFASTVLTLFLIPLIYLSWWKRNH
ncbi:TPA: efflux RND transporter permease subunit [Legionella pneumophila]|uniref:efflux RND transporter permease subunit n=1 Tax=Legionella TaxID=445 RepID=UPI00077096C0|nr:MULTISPECIES: efflux RND transporter permease subunit [Legionella]MCW8397008.1 efflux RND transporter permease subunit [Legionella sp. PATHC039]MCW8465534.1 efflux RND transporter permease subunit [Legionella pneumophila]MDW9003435.1 efflux RND transporter permease subunit [Legionella pneumophila]CZH09718.1 Multidrug-efflux transporter MexB [Legionella pneumophila]CZH44175.1 Multidrug-efflux transporter MexB [Legionella pneumophila]